jgi:4-amino-4-deoxy-L-arabinose transferase-like glycosyltransferase
MAAVVSPARRFKMSPLPWLLLACAACLLPFVNKAYHIDDTLFLYAAQNIQDDPVNFYGSRVNWYENTEVMSDVMKNPPLASYYIALATNLFGWSEPALHLAFLLPALGVIWGTYRLAEQLCSRPALAGLATLLTPAFLVSSTNVMCDTLILCLWVWAVVFWERGLRREWWSLLFLGAVLVSAAALTKYIGVGLIPLLLAYTLARHLGRGSFWATVLRPALVLLIPVLVLLTYEYLTLMMYKHGLLFDAAGYSVGVRDSLNSLVFEVVLTLSFLGGSVAPLVFYAPYLWSWRLWLPSLVLIVGLVLVCAKPLVVGLHFGTEEEIPWPGLAQLGLFVAGGVGAVALTLMDLWTRRDAGAWLLSLWVGGILVFATFLNWTVNVRSLLPLVPAVGILIARRLDQRFPAALSLPTVRLAWPLIPAGALAMFVTYADYEMANASRAAAEEIIDTCYDHPGMAVFQGHWGFQYYMEQVKDYEEQPEALAHDTKRFKAYDFERFNGRPGDLVIYPGNNTNIKLSEPPGPRLEEPLLQIDVIPCPWLATMDPSVGAGFYAGVWGPLPFAFGKVRPARYRVVELAASPASK